VPRVSNSTASTHLGARATGLARLEQTHAGDMMQTHFILTAPQARDNSKLAYAK
jgi:hypothetical protein